MEGWKWWTPKWPLQSNNNEYSNINSPQKDGSVWARYSLKQLWEECCAEADEIGPEGVKELENQLIIFWGYCNQMNFADGNDQLGTAKKLMTTPPRRNIPMTHGKYAGLAERIFNTHNMWFFLFLMT